jgi:hypothetical protein
MQRLVSVAEQIEGHPLPCQRSERLPSAGPLSPRRRIERLGVTAGVVEHESEPEPCMGIGDADMAGVPDPVIRHRVAAVRQI